MWLVTASWIKQVKRVWARVWTVRGACYMEDQEEDQNVMFIICMFSELPTNQSVTDINSVHCEFH
jgi:hypothetical protein